MPHFHALIGQGLENGARSELVFESRRDDTPIVCISMHPLALEGNSVAVAIATGIAERRRGQER